MTESSRCRICGASGSDDGHESPAPFVCGTCASLVRGLATGTDPDRGTDSDDVLAFEPISYDYTPDDGEFVYLHPRNQCYRVELREEGEHGGETMIYLQPVPAAESAIPITEFEDEIGAAIAEGTFYRVTIDPEALLAAETTLRSTERLAPDPDEGAAVDRLVATVEGAADETARITGIVDAADGNADDDPPVDEVATDDE